MTYFASMVVVLRDPDASNSYHTWGAPVETYDIDTGYSDLRDPEEYRDWRESHLEGAKELEKRWPEAADYIRQIVEDYRPDDFVEEEEDEDDVPAS